MADLPTILCVLCHQPVDVSTACTDERGKAVHNDCYAKAICNSPEAEGNQSHQLRQLK